MDKLTMAHQMALAIQGTKLLHDMELVSEMAWKYADAMQAEAEKRKPSGLPEALKGEWQPDWSQAPEWAVAWTYDKNAALWWSEVPKIHKNIWDGRVQECANAPSFDYQGNWKNSLRKRPQ